MKAALLFVTAVAVWLLAKFSRFVLEPDYLRVKKGRN